MILWFIEAQLFEGGPAITFGPCHRETALLNAQVLLVVPGGIILSWGVVSPNKMRLECSLQAGLLIIQLFSPRGGILMAWIISRWTNNTSKSGLRQAPKAGKTHSAVLPGGSKLNQGREGTFLRK